jgi:hypothetical protein
MSYTEIGEPPTPPPNPNQQYWYTTYVPGPTGVLPVEITAPRLEAPESPKPIDVPEPSLTVLLCVFLIILILRRKK